MRKLCLKVLEPLILDHRPGVSNEHETLDYIPASRLRGALFEALPRLNAVIDAVIDPETLFGFEGPRWTDAWPASGNFEPFRRLPLCPNTLESKHRPLGWGQIENTSLRQQIIQREMNMGVSRYYHRHSHRPGALYAREAISPGQHFVAYVDSNDLPLASELKINVGTRRSANGRCLLTIEDGNHEDDQDWPGATGSRFDSFSILADSIAIQLLSDAIVPGPCGGYLRGLDACTFSTLAGITVELHASYSASKIVSGWSGKWNLPCESALAIQAGSVFLLQAEGNDFPALSQFAEDLVRRGLGIRTYEGFGTIAVNPPWLQLREDNGIYLLNFDFEKTASESAHKPAKRWPGLDGPNLPNQYLDSLLNDAKKLARDLRKRKDLPDIHFWISAVARDVPANFGEIDYLKNNSAAKLFLDEQRKEPRLLFLHQLELALDQKSEPAQ